MIFYISNSDKRVTKIYLIFMLLCKVRQRGGQFKSLLPWLVFIKLTPPKKIDEVLPLIDHYLTLNAENGIP